MTRQLALGLKTEGFPSFEAYVGSHNRETLEVLREAVRVGRSGLIYLWGPDGTGKTHLLQAACLATPAGGIYLPLQELKDRGPALLEALESRRVVCLDDLEAVAGEPAWEEALFHLHNRAHGAGALVVAAGRAPPRGLGIRLPDLESRLVGGLSLSLKAPSDEVLIAIIRSMARRRGLKVTEDALRYLMSRERRELGHLAALVERLDGVSLASQRRVTVPLLKSVLGG